MEREYIIERLFQLQDLKYRDFHSRLVPNIDKESIIGVRTPDLRKLSKELSRTDAVEIIFSTLPHQYYEENNLHGFFIQSLKDYDECIKRLDEFLPYVNNWATCDFFSPKVFKKNRDRLLEDIKRWIKSEHEYEVRFAIGMMMTHFLDEDFKPECLEVVASVRREEYYIKMMVAWFFATALAKQWDHTVEYVEKQRLEPWTHNKTIQKARESYRITAEQKEYLKTQKVTCTK